MQVVSRESWKRVVGLAVTSSGTSSGTGCETGDCLVIIYSATVVVSSFVFASVLDVAPVASPVASTSRRPCCLTSPFVFFLL